MIRRRIARDIDGTPDVAIRGLTEAAHIVRGDAS